jgi:N utilization substance protein A
MNFVRVEVDRAEAIMPVSESIPNEFYRSSDRKRFLLVRLQNSASDKRMVLSRGSGDFLKALFELEVPEIATGSVEIMGIAREAGSRSKIAVQSTHEKVDAIGSCVGPRGTRIDSIMNEINPEKVDIILYDNDIKNFIVNSLSPAKVMGLKVNTEEESAIVLVAEDMLSLAIGKDGQNVRLAAKLTGYKIDITADPAELESFKESTKEKKVTKSDNLAKNAEIDFNIGNLDLTKRQKTILAENNIHTKEQLEDLISGKNEIKQLTKRDLAKLEQLIS